MSLQNLHRADVQSVVLNTGDFAEEVLYTPKNPQAAPVTIKALVLRHTVEARDGSGQYRTATVTIANDADSGLVTPEMGDTIALELRPGYPDESVRVTNVDTESAKHVLEVTR